MGLLTAWRLVSAVNKMVKRADKTGQKPTVAEVVGILQKEFPGTELGLIAKVVQAAFLEQKRHYDERFIDALDKDIPEEGSTVRTRLTDGTVVLGILIRATQDEIEIITPDEEHEVIPFTDVRDVEPVMGGILVGRS